MYCNKCGKEITDDSEPLRLLRNDGAYGAGQIRPPAARSVPPPMECSRGSHCARGVMLPSPFAPPPRKSAPPGCWAPRTGGDRSGGAGAGLRGVQQQELRRHLRPRAGSEDFNKAIEKRDAAMLLGTTDPSYRSAIKKALGQDYEQYFGDYFFTGFQRI